MVELLTKRGVRKDLADAPTVAAVVDVVQRIASALYAGSPDVSDWRPRDIRSREDIEHWALRLSSLPPAAPGSEGPIALADLMRSAMERMNELGPRRAARR
jgi:hypothetical protein